MKGILYGVGVGPGDPDLMTMKAIKLIKDNDVIAVVGKEAKEAVAYKIAKAAVPEIEEKELLGIYMPMVMDKEEQQRNHEAGAKLVEKYLDEGKNVVYITLGDSTVYCTFTYLQDIVEADGYQTALVPGITSFCAAAARLNKPLVLWNEVLHIVPAAHSTQVPIDQPGNYVLMKSGSHMATIKQLLRESKKSVNMVENCGMENEKIYWDVEEIPDDAGYFSLIIAKDTDK